MNPLSFTLSLLLGGYQIHIVNPEHVKNVLVTNSTQFERPDFLKKLIGFKSSGNTLFRSNGKEHALRRKLLNPSFSYYSVQSYIPVFNKAAKDLIEVCVTNIIDKCLILRQPPIICVTFLL